MKTDHWYKATVVFLCPLWLLSFAVGFVVGVVVVTFQGGYHAARD